MAVLFFESLENNQAVGGNELKSNLTFSVNTGCQLFPTFEASFLLFGQKKENVRPTIGL